MRNPALPKLSTCYQPATASRIVLLGIKTWGSLEPPIYSGCFSRSQAPAGRLGLLSLGYVLNLTVVWEVCCLENMKG